MRAEGAGRAVDLAQVLLVLDVPQLTVQTVDVDGELLAERGRCGRLAVGEGEQGLVLVFLGLGGEVVDDLLERRRPYLLHRVLHATGGGQVVDVLGGAGEVHKGLERVVDVGELGRRFVELVVDVVFHGLHVMVGHGLMGGMLLDAFGAEVLGDGPQEGDLGVGERLHAFDDRLVAVAVEAVGQQDHPFDFHAHALAVQRRLAQIFDERCGLLVVASVERGQCNCGGDVSKLHSIPDYFQP